MPRAIVNVESSVAVFFALAVCLPGRRSGGDAFQQTVQLAVKPRLRPELFIILGVIALPFLITVRAPLLYDSYAHVVRASQERWTAVLASFYAHPTSGDFFFRPLGYVAYWLEGKWAGFDVVRWHSDGIVLHLLAVICLYLLAQQLGLTRLGCGVAVLMFGLYAGNPEVVTWVAARFDELCTCFVLSSLFFVCRYVDGSTGSLFFVLLTAVCAMFAKEAAYCLPLLVPAVLAFRSSAVWTRRSSVAVLSLSGVMIVILSYRSWVVHGVGGYGAASGTPLALHVSVIHLLELLCFRMWSVLLFPMNWAVHPGHVLVLSLFLGLLGLTFCIALCRPNLRRMVAALAFCVVALLPASSFALLDASMLGIRLYHLSAIGLGLMFAVIVEGVPRLPAGESRRFFVLVQLVMLGLLISCQVGMLCHNLQVWRSTAELAGKTCASVPTLVHPLQPVCFKGLPASYNGVPFLSNAFPECVLVNSGRKIATRTVDNAGAVGQQELTWDPKLRVLTTKRVPH